jgi:poly-gamma-glutamate capsule biosynthesis protein CapA/YwtB (metallophosphatase superfamily)
LRIALAGDTMLGRGVAERLETDHPHHLFSDELVEITRSADLFLLNLECCISTRGERWPASGKPFFFRAPPAAAAVLKDLGVDCVTLANNHALDFGHDALLDTFELLKGAGITWVGAGRDLSEARRHEVMEAGGTELAVLGVTDHPADFAAAEDRPGVAYADLKRGVPQWLSDSIAAAGSRPLLILVHWGPNMNPDPLDHVRAAGEAFVRDGATFVAGHSAHVFQGVRPRIIYDLGDFIDDYATDQVLRNDLGLLWLVDMEGSEPPRVEAVPLKLDYCHTRLAADEDSEWIAHRLRAACASLGTSIDRRDGRLVVVSDAPEGSD